MFTTKFYFFISQNTYTNFAKLLVAAEELAQTGECDPQEISSEARQLKERMNSFLERAEHRRNVLDMSLAFYTHTKEVRRLIMINPLYSAFSASKAM